MIESTEKLLHRALTVGGIGRTESGELSPVTRGIYAHWYARACRWKLTELGESSRTFTPEQVAQYAQWLVRQGYARSTAGLAVRAIRWGHRVAGFHVPDGLPATYVLRGAHSTAEQVGDVNDLDVPARRDPSELLAAFVSGCMLRSVKGDRDRCIVNLLYATGLSAERLVGLNLDQVRSRADIVFVGPSAGPETLLVHAGTWHEASTCPVCTVRAYVAALAAAGVRTGPLLRSVDKGGNVGGGTAGKAGGHRTPGGRLSMRGLTSKVLPAIAADAGLAGLIGPSAVRALRLAGAAAAFKRGEATLEQTAIRAGYRPGSALLLAHLLDLVTPREDT
jgi:hypothetical protein